MFGRQAKENKPEETSDMADIMFPSESEIEEASQADTEISEVTINAPPKTAVNNPEIVNIVEKISGIVSPYFIVVVGLILSEENFWLGLLLITVGILSLLKISWGDIAGFFGEIKDVFTSDE